MKFLLLLVLALAGCSQSSCIIDMDPAQGMVAGLQWNHQAIQRKGVRDPTIQNWGQYYANGVRSRSALYGRDCR
jgi:hypothetical protein